MALVQAIQAGADEALMLDIHGFVSTCNATNFFMVKRDEVWTSTGQYCMNGITRGKVIGLGRQDGMVVREKNFSLTDVYDADEAFVTGTFGGLTPVTEIDGRTIDAAAIPGPITQRLSGLYQQAIEQYVQAANAKSMMC
jgi:branched-chain amino acid aminotransferase